MQSPSDLQAYVRKVFMGNSLNYELCPDERDVQVATESLRGKEIREIGETSVVYAALKRVRDAIRRGESPPSIRKEFPKIVAWQEHTYGYRVPPRKLYKGAHPPDGGKPIAIRPSQGVEGSPEPLPPEDSIPGIDRIMESDFPDPDPNEPRTFHEFLGQVRSVAAVPMMKLLSREICLRLARHDPVLKEAMEYLGISSRRGPMLAQQFNLANPLTKEPPALPSSTGLSFEAMVKQVESEDDSGFGVGAATAVIEQDVDGEEDEE